MLKRNPGRKELRVTAVGLGVVQRRLNSSIWIMAEIARGTREPVLPCSVDLSGHQLAAKSAKRVASLRDEEPQYNLRAATREVRHWRP